MRQAKNSGNGAWKNIAYKTNTFLDQQIKINTTTWGTSTILNGYTMVKSKRYIYQYRYWKFHANSTVPFNNRTVIRWLQTTNEDKRETWYQTCMYPLRRRTLLTPMGRRSAFVLAASNKKLWAATSLKPLVFNAEMPT